MNILFLVPYPLQHAPSQRFRFEQYFEALKKKGHSFRVQSFLNDDKWQEFAQAGPLLPKLLSFLKGFLRRIAILSTIRTYDIIFIHREVTPLGPPTFEWLIAKLFKKRIIYDFDDAVWLTDRKNESYFFEVMKWRSKIKSICAWSHKVSCGNHFLCDYASKFSKNTVYNPTTVHTAVSADRSTSERFGRNEIILGWTGSNSTLKYLSDIETQLQDIQDAFPHVSLLVIADKKPSIRLSRLIYKPWRIATEIEDLSDIDIGIMPLPNNEWTQGKCGFKALQYMALGIPTIASSVGANLAIIDHGINGFLITSPEEWKKYCSLLISNINIRKEIGMRGKQKVVTDYSVSSNEERFLSLFE